MIVTAQVHSAGGIFTATVYNKQLLPHKVLFQLTNQNQEG